MSRLAAVARSSFRHTMIKVAPSFARALAVPKPTPRLAPVNEHDFFFHSSKVRWSSRRSRAGPQSLWCGAAQLRKEIDEVAVGVSKQHRPVAPRPIGGGEYPRADAVFQASVVRANEAQLAYLRQQRADAELKAPLDTVVRSRLMEPGEMASPQKPVFSLAVVDPKWVRAYVSEPDLGKLHTE